MDPFLPWCHGWGTLVIHNIDMIVFLYKKTCLVAQTGLLVFLSIFQNIPKDYSIPSGVSGSVGASTTGTGLVVV